MIGSIALVALSLYAVGLLALAWISMHPMRVPIFFSPGAIGAPQEEVEFVNSEGLRLRGWWLPHSDAPAVAVLAHGYLMNRSEVAPLAFRLWQRGIPCLMFDFRAHGRSQGKKCTLGYREADDVRAAVEYARARCPGAKVVMIGNSMGGAASIRAAYADPGLVDLLVLDGVFGRLSEAILGWWRTFGGKVGEVLLYPTAILASPLAGFNPFKVDLTRMLQELPPIPILFLHGDRDVLVPPAVAERNFAAATGPKALVWMPGCGHGEARFRRPAEYEAAIVEFLTSQGIAVAQEIGRS